MQGNHLSIEKIKIQLLSKKKNVNERLLEIAQLNWFHNFCVNKNVYLNNKNYQIDYLVTNEYRIIKNKLYQDSKYFTDFFTVTTGVQVYHNTIHDKETIKFRKYHSSKKNNNNYMKIYNGTDIERYFSKEPSEYLEISKKVYRRPNDSFIKSKKILVQEILGRGRYKIKSSIVNEDSIWANTAFGIISINKSYQLGYLMTLLNSYLFTWFLLVFSDKAYATGDFSRIPQTNIRNLPIKCVSIEEQNPFIEKAIDMNNINITFNYKLSEFLEWLKLEYKIEKLSQKLESFYELDFDEMKQEVKKKMPKSSSFGPKEIGEFKKYFDEYKTELVSIKSEIDKTDREIDRMVYELYGLTDEEIGIVEGSL